ncbi:ABC transporter ATP-binding protein [Streptomyces sp. AC627_RSS907]|uniref:ABC transporter ATP-binding protein n=1 Tax=Streptomyces sp. AC627_RSS907 TaxID=2823684 RepID=UPI001C242227|nr:ABC transporter ATP-binding protein [Streptomyces sp. AC627_RSS907]
MTATPPDPDVLLSVRDLGITLHGVPAVSGLAFDVRAREVLAVVGESGAGKSLTAHALLGSVPRGALLTGSVRLRRPPGSYDELVGARASALAALRGRRTALVPQDALSALSPVHSVGDQLAAAVRSVARVSRTEARARAVAALDRVGIADAARKARAYPHEYSGGMRQRAVIAMATINEPDLLVADEPTTALDPDLQEQVLRVLGEQREAVGAALVLVTHDLGTVRDHADRVLVMYAGRQAEQGSARDVLDRPAAPYTAGLLASLPPAEAGGRSGCRRLPTIPGAPPAFGRLPPGCAFAPRCPLADDSCRREEPRSRTVGPGHEASCHRWEDVPRPAAELFLERSV